MKKYQFILTLQKGYTSEIIFHVPTPVLWYCPETK
jgi:hypothetical protein